MKPNRHRIESRARHYSISLLTFLHLCTNPHNITTASAFLNPATVDVSSLRHRHHKNHILRPTVVIDERGSAPTNSISFLHRHAAAVITHDDTTRPRSNRHLSTAERRSRSLSRLHRHPFPPLVATGSSRCRNLLTTATTTTPRRALGGQRRVENDSGVITHHAPPHDSDVIKGDDEGASPTRPRRRLRRRLRRKVIRSRTAAATTSTTTVANRGTTTNKESPSPDQRRSITSTAPAVLLHSGPGTGKSRVLSSRIAYLLLLLNKNNITT
mmetsp:Transcript_58451/g.69774  ORF Transcript_58451/g.69774 Transcript_58451/m.69774 type:complete len:270 (-) Transcript_58451:333-1142(-)